MSYGTLADLTNVGVGANALANVPTPVQQAALDANSGLMDSYFADVGALPMLAWPVQLNRCNAILAAYELLVVRGYNPAAGADDNFRLRYKDQLDWLGLVARKVVQLVGVTWSPSSTNYTAPQIISSSVVSVATGQRRQNRGW
jgi:phage gp36-like protein